ncbi:hypothetical protein ACU4GD_41770 [Cupriavidus basilensis]
MTSATQLHGPHGSNQRAAAFGAELLAARPAARAEVMYAGTVAVPLIIGGALKLPKDQLAFLINADLLRGGPRPR